MKQRRCSECQHPIKGRSDKRFCDDACRNTYHNRLNSDQNNLIRNINNTLRKNRRILEKILDGEKKVKISLDYLLKKGFDFDYMTHQLQIGDGKTYVFIYEYGYLSLDTNLYLLVKKIDETG